MTKQVPLRIANLMFDLQEYCKSKNHQCSQCKYYNGQLGMCLIKQMWRDTCDGLPIPPRDWGITKADIERLERESNDS
jgi:hypothetical protein